MCNSDHLQKDMDSIHIHNLMNLLFPILIPIITLCCLPFYLTYKFVSSFIIKPLYTEDVAGKVVLITGASAGIGECLAYEYAKKRARLVLSARRADRLKQVSDMARRLGSPEVLVIPADVSSLEDCKKLISDTVNHFGRFDHLVNNAGISGEVNLFDDVDNISSYVPVMDTNFWGSVYCTHFAIPHLKRSKGKIVVMSSADGWFSAPRASIYGATKAATASFYETLRTEYGSQIGITIVTPGFIYSEMITPDTIEKMRINFMPIASREWSAKAIVEAACRGDVYFTVPAWVRVGFLVRVIAPEVLSWLTNRTLITNPKPTSNHSSSSSSSS